MAVDLYEDAKLMPGASTGRHLRTQHGLVVNGPLFPNPAEGPACLLYAAQNGRPCVVKMLDGHVLPGESGSPGGTEARAVRYGRTLLRQGHKSHFPLIFFRALCTNLPSEAPLAQCKLITLVLPPEHTECTGRAPSFYAALVMPKYASKSTACNWGAWYQGSP